MRVKMYFKRRKVSQSLRDSYKAGRPKKQLTIETLSISFHVEAGGGGWIAFELK